MAWWEEPFQKGLEEGVDFVDVQLVGGWPELSLFTSLLQRRGCDDFWGLWYQYQFRFSYSSRIKLPVQVPVTGQVTLMTVQAAMGLQGLSVLSLKGLSVA